MEHSRLAPSSMSRIILCPGSAVANPPDTGGAAAKQGTHAHDLCEQVLRGFEVEFPDDEMRQAVFLYVGYVKSFVSDYKASEPTELFIESRLVSEMTPDHGGTMDVIIVTPTTLHVVDLKYGLQPVSPFENKQLLSYLALANEKYPGRKKFFATIVQPRVFGNPQAVAYSKQEIVSHELDVHLVADDTSRHAGDWCKYCPLKESCEVVQLKLDSVSKDTEDPAEWDAEKCIDIIGMAAVLKKMAVDAKERLGGLLIRGQTVDGWKLVHDLGNKSWKDEEKVIDELQKKGIEDGVIFNKKVKSPTQLLKFSRAYEPFVASMAHREDKGVIAAPSTSRLPDYVNTKSAFTDLPSS